MKPRLLLVEDDPASCAYMAAVIASFPAEVDKAASVGSAFALAMSRDHALWLFDARLPDGNGIELLARLRQQGRSTPALAHTASRDAEELAALAQAGFQATLIKPFTAAELREALTSALGGSVAAVADQVAPPDRAEPLWDDDGALNAMNGNRDHVTSLRALFLAELPLQRDAVLAALARGEPQAARELLHRLKASCGFVGAPRLKAMVEVLDAALHEPQNASAFAAAVEATLAAPHGGKVS